MFASRVSNIKQLGARARRVKILEEVGREPPTPRPPIRERVDERRASSRVWEGGSASPNLCGGGLGLNPNPPPGGCCSNNN